MQVLQGQVQQAQRPPLAFVLALDRLLVQVLQRLRQLQGLQQLEEQVLEVVQGLGTNAGLELEVQPGSSSSTPAKFRLP